MNRSRTQRVLMALVTLAAAGGLTARAQDDGAWKRDVAEALGAARAQEYAASEQAFQKGSQCAS